MFDDWMNVWRETVDSFDRELHGDDGDSASRGMRRQLIAARSALAKIQADIDRAAADAATEAEARLVCLRREAMARDINDDETARIAAEYAERHAVRADLYERKAMVLREEHALMLGDLELMEAEFGARVDSAESIEDAEPSSRRKKGASVLDDIDRAEQDQQDLELARMRRERAASEKLEEMKRRMRG